VTEQRRRRAYDDSLVRDVKGFNAIGVLHTPAGRPLREAVDYLAQNKIGLTMVIASDGTLAGVISERDVVRALYEHGNHALNMSVDTFMARDVVTCSENDRIVDVAKIMTDRHIRHLPIVDDGFLSGMISATDLVKHYASKA